MCCLGIVRYSWVSVLLLVDLTDLITREQISNENIILSCFKYFLSYLQLRLLDDKTIDTGNTCISGTYTKNICIKRAYIESTLKAGIYAKNICI